MKRNFDAVLTSFDGTPFKDGNPKFKRNDKGGVELGENGEPVILEPAKDLTLRTVCISALGAQIPGDEAMEGGKKLGILLLAGRIGKGGMVEVTTEEVTLIKQRIARTHSMFATGSAYLLLEADPEPAEATA